MHKVQNRNSSFSFSNFRLCEPKKTKQKKQKQTSRRWCFFYLLLCVVDPQQKDQLGQKHGCRRVGVDAPGVGLETPQAGQHHDGEEEAQHGEAQRGVCDQGQRLQVPLQLLLTEKSREQRVGFCAFIQHANETVKTV